MGGRERGRRATAVGSGGRAGTHTILPATSRPPSISRPASATAGAACRRQVCRPLPCLPLSLARQFVGSAPMPAAPAAAPCMIQSFAGKFIVAGTGTSSSSSILQVAHGIMATTFHHRCAFCSGILPYAPPAGQEPRCYARTAAGKHPDYWYSGQSFFAVRVGKWQVAGHHGSRCFSPASLFLAGPACTSTTCRYQLRQRATRASPWSLAVGNHGAKPDRHVYSGAPRF